MRKKCTRTSNISRCIGSAALPVDRVWNMSCQFSFFCFFPLSSDSVSFFPRDSGGRKKEGEAEEEEEEEEEEESV